ncbi:MAG: hypothetical protein P1P87_11235 [Trueperaceae bacterium]|nr:hypothetical protein [Trueperaceae bacterium]
MHNVAGVLERRHQHGRRSSAGDGFGCAFRAFEHERLRNRFRLRPEAIARTDADPVESRVRTVVEP